MKGKDLALATFVILTLVFASLALALYSQREGAAATATVTTFTTVTITCPMNIVCGSFSYNTSGNPTEVTSAEASNGSANGQAYVAFDVEFENVGDYPIYLPGGLSVTVPANSPVLVAYPVQKCAQTFEVTRLGPDQSYSVSGPPCGDGIAYAIAQAGRVDVALSFHWTTNATANSFPNSTTISAQFDFP